MLRPLVLVVLVCGAFCVTRYDNFKVFEITAETDEEVVAIHNLDKTTNFRLDVWREAGLNITAHINVGPEEQVAFMAKLREMNLDFTVLVENVQDQIEAVDLAMAKIPKSQRNIKNSYLRNYEIRAYLDDLQTKHSDRMNIKVFGSSGQDRDLYYVRLTSLRYHPEGPENSNKPVIWMESTTHAREWITAACTLNLIEWLIEGYGLDSEATELLDKFDWFIVPVHNPDGYEHSWSNRLWRKTRSNHGSCFEYQGSGIGVDPNRNWAFGWGVNGQTNRCYQDFQGPSSFSEPETDLMAKEMGKTPSDFRRAFISLHSYSQMILMPYGYDKNVQVGNYNEQLRVANLARQAILDNSGTNFRVGKPGDLLYNAPGGAYDFALGGLGFTYSFTYELHPDTGNPGFQLPPDKIEPSFSDFLQSIKAIADNIQEP